MAAVLALLAAAATAHRPATSAGCDRRSPAVRGGAALGLIRYPVADLDYRIAFLGPRKGVLGTTFTGANRIEVYVRPCQTVAAVASILGHEVGHAIDDRLMTPARRGEYLAVRGISGEWFGCNRCTDYRTPAGDYAEVAATLFAPAGPWRSLMASRPTGAALATLRPFFVAAPPPPPQPVPLVTTTTTTLPAPCRVAVGQSCLVQ